ncbi:MAG TPA: alpha/beta hydrolase [Stellaceae bacterium]|jgi:acetyl esterase|nr:alpha/beta hydrolase [Stellaceae bacterium]
MALDKQAQHVIDLIVQAGRPGYQTMTAPEARLAYKETRGPLQAPPPEVAEVVERSIDGPGGKLALRLYRPLGSPADAALPALVYFHGGGWTIGDLDTHDVICRLLASRAGCAVVAVDYRLAPEAKFPAAVEDCWAATRWVREQGAAIGVDPQRIAVGGDSAGGNLAAVVALLARDADLGLAFQLLIYPATDFANDKPSHELFAEGYMLTRTGIAWFTGNYLVGPADTADWRASPLRAASLAGVAPALVVTAGFDPLRDEGKAYAERLAAAGVPVRYVCYDGMIHGFFGMTGKIDTARHAIDEAGAALKVAFAPA